MNKALKVVILLAIFNLGGCCFNSCKDIPQYFDITRFDAVIKQISSENPNGTLLLKSLDSNTIINYDDLIIQLISTVTYYGDNSLHGKINFGSFFINSSFACSCDDPGLSGTAERILEINIFSSYPFTSAGSTSDTLSKYFDFSGEKNMYANVMNNQLHGDLDSFTKTNSMALQLINFRLKVKPTGSLKHKFTIQYKHKNGEIFTLTTPTIQFNP